MAYSASEPVSTQAQHPQGIFDGEMGYNACGANQQAGRPDLLPD